MELLLRAWDRQRRSSMEMRSMRRRRAQRSLIWERLAKTCGIWSLLKGQRRSMNRSSNSLRSLYPNLSPNNRRIWGKTWRIVSTRWASASWKASLVTQDVMQLITSQANWKVQVLSYQTMNRHQHLKLVLAMKAPGHISIKPNLSIPLPFLQWLSTIGSLEKR